MIYWMGQVIVVDFCCGIIYLKAKIKSFTAWVGVTARGLFFSIIHALNLRNDSFSQGFALLSMSILWWIERKQERENESGESDRLITGPGTVVRYDSAMVA